MEHLSEEATVSPPNTASWESASLSSHFTHLILQPSKVNVSPKACEEKSLSASFELRVSNSYSKAIIIFEPIRRSYITSNTHRSSCRGTRIPFTLVRRLW